MRLRFSPQSFLVVVLVAGVCALPLLSAGGAPDQNKKPHDTGLLWNPPDTDKKVEGVSETPACNLGQVMQQAGDRASDLVDTLSKFDATELSEFVQYNQAEQQVDNDAARFDYTVDIEHNPGHLAMKEARVAIDAPHGDSSQLEDVGLIALAMIFHPLYSVDFAFSCEGAVDWNGQPAWVIRFQQFKGRPSRLVAFRSGNQVYGAKLKGRAWISRDTGEVIRLETNLMEPIGLLQLHANAIVVDYGPVQFHTADVKLWLPQSAQAYSVYDLYKLVKHHTYSDFKLFSVGSSFVAEKPKGAKDAKDAPTPSAAPTKPVNPQ
jgi:hypothetical protein